MAFCRKGGKRMNNYDRIRSMNIEEFASFMEKTMPCDLCVLGGCDVDIKEVCIERCKKEILNWLKQEETKVIV